MTPSDFPQEVDEFLSILDEFTAHLDDDIMIGIHDVLLNSDITLRFPDSIALNPLDDILDFLEDITDTLDNILTDFSNNFLANLNTSINGIITGVLSGIDDIIGAGQAVITGTLGEIENKVSELVDGTEDLIDDVSATVEDLLDPVLASVTETLDSITFTFNNTIDPVLSGILATTNTIIEEIQGIGAVVGESIEEVFERLPEALDKSFTGGLTSIFGRISGLFDFFNRDALNTHLEDVDDIFQEIEQDPDAGPLFSKFSRTGLPPLLMGAAGAIIAVLVVLPIQIAAAFFAGVTEKIRQSGFKRDRPTIFSPADLFELSRRGMVDQDQFLENFRRLGYPDESIAQVQALVRNLLNVSEITSLWRRGDISREEASIRINQLGFDDADTEHILALVFPIPPIQDIITFAVREVWKPQQAEKFGQFEGLTRETIDRFLETITQGNTEDETNTLTFEQQGLRAGLSPEWIAAYWGSHWVIPSPNQLFEMFQRRFIDDEELESAIKAKDFTPFWRDKLKAIAFRPLTRVDIRRMHDLGLIDREEVKLRYRDIGFSPADAELMTIFTEAFNDSPTEEEELDTRELTRSQVTGFFEDGLIDREEAVSLLQEMGFDPAQAEIIISDVELKLAREERSARLRAIELRFDSGIIDFNEAITQLDELNLHPVRRDSFLARLEAEQASRLRLPSRGELDDFADEGIINREEYISELLRLGFPGIWAERFAVLHYGPRRDI